VDDQERIECKHACSCGISGESIPSLKEVDVWTEELD
jgi:hypothetical protein